MKILIAPDSFKGSLSAKEVADFLEKGLMKCMPSLTIQKLPLGDGGEGTLDALITNEIYSAEEWLFNDPFVSQRKAVVGVGEQQIYFESASVLGLPWFCDKDIPFERRNSRALGILIRQAVEKGYRAFQIGLGGTGCHDWGLGLAHEMGVGFFDRDGNELREPWSNPNRIHRFSLPDTVIHIKALSDIDAPLMGKMGAAFGYARQKGGSEPEILEEISFHLLETVKQSTGRDLSDLKGGAAAGGLGFGLASFFNAEITSGIQTVSKSLQLEKQIVECDLIITGEGKIDDQSFDGKVLSGVLELAKKHQKPIVLVCGRNEIKSNLPKEVIRFFETSAFAKTEEESVADARNLLENKVSLAVNKLFKERLT